ncbi:MAG: VOC family protein [Deltaproteobacteria bacterium]|nr:VOC family protein [Deltaproteobacteria bacterium]
MPRPLDPPASALPRSPVRTAAHRLALGAVFGLALGLALGPSTGCATRGGAEAAHGGATASPPPAAHDSASAATTPAASTTPSTPPAPVVLFPALNVLDLEPTVAFYVELMGMRETLRLGDATTERIEVTLSYGDTNGAGASLVLQRENGRTQPYVFDAFSRIAFRVPDVDALVARIRAAGHRVVVEPHFIEAMGMKIRLAFVEDPNGARVELIGVVPRDGA